MWIYFILFFVLLILSGVGYIRIQMRFWHLQPVFHIYNIVYWFKPPGLINKKNGHVLYNKYVNIVNIQTTAIDTLPERRLTQCAHFIKNYFVRDKSATYRPTQENIFAYLQSASNPGYLSVYTQKQLLVTEGNAVAVDDEILAVITANSLIVRRADQPDAFSTYYIDNLCVKPSHRKKGLAPQMIQTLYYNLSCLNPQVQTFLFKREGTLTAIVPFIAYTTYCYDISRFRLPLTPEGIYVCLLIAPAQLHLFVNFILEARPRFSWSVLPDVSNITHLLKTNNIVIYGILQKTTQTIVAVYVFRSMELFYHGKKTVECIMIVSSPACSEKLLSQGFQQALHNYQSSTASVGMLLLDELADAAIVRKQLPIKPYFASPTALYFYNYACYTCKSNKAMILY
jgi:hypothetical protein